MAFSTDTRFHRQLFFFNGLLPALLILSDGLLGKLGETGCGILSLPLPFWLLVEPGRLESIGLAMRKGTILLSVCLALAVSTTANAAKKKKAQPAPAPAPVVVSTDPTDAQRAKFFQDAMNPFGAK